MKRTPKTRRRPPFDVDAFLASSGVARVVRECAPGTVLFAQGDRADSVIYVQKGAVKLGVVSRGGREAVVAMLGPGDFVGEGALAGQRLRIGTATAVAPTTVLVIEKRKMQRVLHTERGMADRFMAYGLRPGPKHPRRGRPGRSVVQQERETPRSRATAACSFCSVWRTDGQEPRTRSVDAVVREIVALRRTGFRFIALADDNFYPITLKDIETAGRRADPAARAGLVAIREERFDLLRELARLPDDLVFFTQITMEAAEDPEFLAAMRRANIKGALLGVESVTTDGLHSIYKDFNLAGEALVERLRAFRANGIHVLGSFIFGLPTDRRETFDATLERAARADLTFAQFVMLAVCPGTVDCAKWEASLKGRKPRVGDTPITRHWLIPETSRPRIYVPHPTMSADEILQHTQRVWDRFHSIREVWATGEVCRDAPFAPRVRAHLEAVPPDVREYRHRDRQRARESCLALGALDCAAMPAAVRRPPDA